MPKFMFLLYDEPAGWANISPDEMQKIIERYVAWGAGLREKGALLASDKLADDAGRVMRKGDGKVRVTDGPYSETKEVLGGHYTVSAPSYEAAIDLARDCPHLDYGGTIEVRQIDEMMG
jgi:hypothetical protein